jgi:hypothetical protein
MQRQSKTGPYDAFVLAGSAFRFSLGLYRRATGPGRELLSWRPDTVGEVFEDRRAIAVLARPICGVPVAAAPGCPVAAATAYHPRAGNRPLPDRRERGARTRGRGGRPTRPRAKKSAMPYSTYSHKSPSRTRAIIVSAMPNRIKSTIAGSRSRMWLRISFQNMVLVIPAAPAGTSRRAERSTCLFRRSSLPSPGILVEPLPVLQRPRQRILMLGSPRAD